MTETILNLHKVRVDYTLVQMLLFLHQNGTHDENFIVMSDNGSVELYEDNVKRLETSVYGIHYFHC